MAQRLGEEGAIILVCSYEADKNDEAVEKLKKLGIETSSVFCDVSKRDDNINVVKTVIDSWLYIFHIHFLFEILTIKKKLRK